MEDVQCPYCNHEFDICDEYDEWEEPCPECDRMLHIVAETERYYHATKLPVIESEEEIARRVAVANSCNGGGTVE